MLSTSFPRDGFISFTQTNQDITGTKWQLVLYLVLNVVSSNLLLPILIGAMILQKGVHFHPALKNMCAFWMIFSLSRCILFYTGSQVGPDPNFLTCQLQASLVYAQGPTTASASLVLIYQVYDSITKLSRGLSPRSHRFSRTKYYMILFFPIFVMLSVFVACIVTTSLIPKSLSRQWVFFRCSIRFIPLTTAIAWISALFLLFTVFVEAWTVRLMIKWKVVLLKDVPGQGTVMNRHLILTVLIYGCTALILFILSIVLGTGNVPSQFIDWMFTIMPYIVFVVFIGPVWRAWTVKRRSKPLNDANMIETELIILESRLS